MLTIGEAMKKARLDKGFSIMQLSIKAGIGKHNIYHWMPLPEAPKMKGDSDAR